VLDQASLKVAHADPNTLKLRVASLALLIFLAVAFP
jgi:hypothetical protein